jgi:ABC-2 type transport system ATP-binding protein
VSIIRAGKTVQSGSLDELRHLTRTSIEVHTLHPPRGLDEIPGVHDLRIDGDRARFDVDTARLEEVMRRVITFGLRTLRSQPPTLEELFLRHYGDELAEQRSLAHNQHGAPVR